MFIVLTACYVFGWFSLLPDEYEQLGKHILAASGFSENIILYGEAGYFDNAAETKPLLHLWSLGVEEQFYIFWPILVCLLWGRGKSFDWLIVCLVFGSFAFNIYEIKQSTVATFFSPFTRFWELAAGALIARTTVSGQKTYLQDRCGLSDALSLLGFSLICLAILITRKHFAFPGWWAILPVLGAVFVILAGNEACINKHLLSRRPMVWLGKISYPLYLWHWPILSYIRIFRAEEPARIFMFLAVALSIFLAWLTYRFLELKLRYLNSRRVVVLLVAAVFSIAAIGLYTYLSHGLPDREMVKRSSYTEEVRRQFTGPFWPYTSNHICLEEYPFEKVKHLAWWFCMKSDERPATLILLGNSFGNQLYPGFANNVLLKHHTILSIGDCDFSGISPSEDLNSPCYGARTLEQEIVINKLISDSAHIKYAIIDGVSRNPSGKYIEAFAKRVALLEQKGIRVIVFTPHIYPNFNPIACFGTPLRQIVKDCKFPEKKRKELYDGFLPLVNALSKSHPKVLLFNQNDMFCSNGHCSYVRNGMPLHRDNAHLSEYGSTLLQESFTAWAKDQIPDIFNVDAPRK